MKSTMKKLNLKDVKTGLLVVVNELDDAIIYYVDDIDGQIVKLSYMAGNQKVDSGSIHYGVLMAPTMTQITNSYKKLVLASTMII